MKSPIPSDFRGGLRRKGEGAVLGADLVVYSHLRWDFVFQRPQHLMTRMAWHRRVFFVEEPLLGEEVSVSVLAREAGVRVVVPRLLRGSSGAEADLQLGLLLRKVFEEERIHDFTAWYYTPMALPFTRRFRPRLTVYDCMDELSLFHGAPPELPGLERDLMLAADLVFTGGHALYAAKKSQHANIHPFPSSIEFAHFAQAREAKKEPADQARIPRKRLGFFGVLDERFDAPLVAGIAAARPDWQLVLIGPVAKIDPATLPRARNVHYLGKKDYQELPAYLAGWDLAMIPFARNDSTRYISPTKTPEYLAAGCPVVSTPIADVVQPYGKLGLVKIAGSAGEFVVRAEEAMEERRAEGWQERVDGFLSQTSWETTYLRMAELEAKTWHARIVTRALLDAAAQESKLGA